MEKIKTLTIDEINELSPSELETLLKNIVLSISVVVMKNGNPTPLTPEHIKADNLGVPNIFINI